MIRFAALLEEICWNVATPVSEYRTENRALPYTGEWGEVDRAEELAIHISCSQ